MATSIYIYESLKEYNKIYGMERGDEMRETQLIDLYVREGKLFVVTNTSLHKEQPRLEKSIVHFRNKTLGEWENGEEKLVLHKSLKFNHRKNKLEMFPKFLRKPLLSLRVDRFYGESSKDKKIDYNHRFYDLFRDRINLVMCDKNEV
jgi:hypothetical protein